MLTKFFAYSFHPYVVFLFHVCAVPGISSFHSCYRKFLKVKTKQPKVSVILPSTVSLGTNYRIQLTLKCQLRKLATFCYLDPHLTNLQLSHLLAPPGSHLYYVR